MKETKNKTVIGTVVSTTNDKTITVLVETYTAHPLYKKRVKILKICCSRWEKYSKSRRHS